MPEVCEVTLTSLYLNNKISNATIEKLEVLGGRYSKTPLLYLNDFNNKLPLTIQNIDSKGKQIWFELNNDIYIMSHLGMEGRWSFTKEKHANIVLHLEHNKKKLELYFIDYRNFGRLEFIFNTSAFNKKINEIGIDFLKVSFTHTDLKNRMQSLLYKKDKLKESVANKTIVKILMEGQKTNNGIGSGLGNYLVAEVLYRAKINPQKTLINIYNDINLIKQLTKSIKTTVKLCYLTNITGYMEHITDFTKSIRNKVKNNLLPNYHNDIDTKNLIFCYKVYRQKNDPKGNPVEKIEIIKGRTTYWVPNVQL